MDCKELKQADIIEKYLLAELSEAEQDAFERHYFECADCFAELQTYRALQSELAATAPAIRSEPLGPPRAPKPWRLVWAVGVATVLAVVGLGYWLRSSKTGVSAPTSGAVSTSSEARQAKRAQPPTPSLTELAQVRPPKYMPVVLRGPKDEAMQAFQRAMVHYQKAEYRQAIPGLRAASGLDPKAANAHFFLGICDLITGETDTAIQSLRKTVSLGDSPFLEEAHFYLAKAYLRNGDINHAQVELEATLRLRGDLDADTKQLLDRLRTLGTVSH